MPQQVHFFKNCIQQLPSIFNTTTEQHVLVVTGKHFITNHSSFLASLNSGLCKTVLHVKNTSLPAMEEAETCYNSFKKNNCAAVIAIGGGSVIDLAKTVIFLLKKSGEADKPLFIAAPTTAGSGSEATCFAVLYENKQKISIEHDWLLPDMVFLDATLTLSLTAKQAAISGIDAFAQAIESFWNKKATVASRMLAEEAITIVLTNLHSAVFSDSILSREKMLWGAHVAGKAINSTRTTAPHALSYYLTAHFNIPHGQAVALFLPLFFLYNNQALSLNNFPAEETAIHRQCMKQLHQLLKVNTAEEAFILVRNFIAKAGLATTLTDLQIEKDAILQPLLQSVNHERFSNNPVPFDYENLFSLCKQHL